MEINSKLKKASLGALFALLSFALVSCSEAPTVDSDGQNLRYTFDQIDAEGLEGIYVMNKDETFTPILTNIPGFDGETSESRPDRYLWYQDTSEYEIDNVIPTVMPDTPLVCVYNSAKKIPDVWYLERYDFKGYTVGVHVYLSSDNKMYIFPDDKLSGTSADRNFSSLGSNDEQYEVENISGSDHLPIENVDSNLKMLLGLQKGKVYTFTFYKGTKTMNMNIYADTAVYQSAKHIELGSPYKKTKKGYFIVNLPVNMEDGYYYLSDIGFFKYSNGV